MQTPCAGFFEDKRLVPGARSRVPGTWDPGPGTGSTAEGRTPSTEERAKRAHRLCKMQDTGCGMGLRGKAGVFKSSRTQEAGYLYGHRVGGQ